jgi:hypothetical protein
VCGNPDRRADGLYLPKAHVLNLTDVPKEFLDTIIFIIIHDNSAIPLSPRVAHDPRFDNHVVWYSCDSLVIE